MNHRSPTIAPVKHVVLVAREGERPGAATRKLAADLEALGVTADLLSESSTLLGQSKNVDLYIALGGDGTVLRALRAANGEAPVVGINFGNLGFLTYGGPEMLDAMIGDACAGKLRCKPRIRLLVGVTRGGKILPEATALAYNDAVIKVGANPRLLDLRCEVDGRRLANYKADGLIFATPLGSTAYNLAAGGPILDPDTEAYAITALNPHSVTHRPVVMSARTRASVTLMGPPNTDANLMVDGEAHVVPLQVGDRVGIFVDSEVSCVVPPEGSVFDILRAKMGWDGGGE